MSSFLLYLLKTPCYEKGSKELFEVAQHFIWTDGRTCDDTNRNRHTTSLVQIDAR